MKKYTYTKKDKQLAVLFVVLVVIVIPVLISLIEKI
jgi:hypothetical protein